MQFLGVKKECSTNVFFWNQTEKSLAEEFAKRENFSAVLQKYIIFDVKLIEVYQMSEVFWAKLYCNMRELFRLFLLTLRRSAR